MHMEEPGPVHSRHEAWQSSQRPSLPAYVAAGHDETQVSLEPLRAASGTRFGRVRGHAVQEPLTSHDTHADGQR